MYESQTRCKKWRQWNKNFGSYFEIDKCYEEIYSKHFKKYYNEKSTKRYLKLMQKFNKAKRFTASDIENLFLM